MTQIELEPLIQRFEVDARAYMTAIDQMERGLNQTSRAATAATGTMNQGFRVLGQQTTQAANQVVNAAGRMSTAYRGVGVAGGNAANQLADFVIQVQAGQDPLRAMTQQLSQALIFMGPWGAALGAAAAVAGAAASAFFSMGDSAEDTGGKIQSLTDRLDALSSEGVSDLSDLFEAMAKLSPEMERLSRVELEIETTKMVRDLEAARQAFDELLNQVTKPVDLGATQVGELGLAGQGIILLQQIKELLGEAPDPELLRSLEQLFQRMRDGQIDVDEFLADLNQFTRIEGVLGDAVRKAIGPILEQAVAIQKVQEELRKAGTAVSTLGSGARFVPLPPETPASGERRLRELDRPRGGGRAAVRQATFEDVVVPLEREVTLLGEVENTREAISAIMSAENQLKRALTDSEMEHLLAVQRTRDGLIEQRNIAARTAQEQERARDRQRQTELRTMTNLRQQRERADFDVSQARVAETSDIIGLPPPRSFFEEQERFRLQQQVGRGEITPQYADSLEPMIEDLARAQQQLQLMTETAPELAGTLGQIGQTAVFEGLEAAGEQFLAMLTDMLFQALALQLIMAAIGLIAPGATPAVGGFLGPGQGLGVSGFGGPRQHGGPVRRGTAYMVGEAGPEMFVPGQSGTIVPNRAGSGGGDRGGPDITVNVVNSAPNTKVETQADEPGGNINILIDEMVAGNINRSGTATNRAMRDRFGLSFQTRR